MSDMVDKMVRAEGTDVSWHGKENTLSPNASIEQWLDEAGLNWKVCGMPILVQGHHENRIAPAFKALVRSDNAAVLDVVSQDFRVHQNRDLVNVFKSFCEAGDLTLDTMACLAGGKKIFANARVNGDIAIKTPTGTDFHQMYFVLSTGHYAGFCTQADLTETRVVCNNTLTMARNAKASEETRWRLTHLGNWTAAREKEVQALLSRALGRVPTVKEEWERLYNAPCGRLLEALFYTEQFQPELFQKVVAKAHQRTLKVGAFEVGLPNAMETGSNRSRAAARLTTLDALANDHDARTEIVQTLLRPDQFSRTVTTLLETSRTQPGASLSLNTLAHPVNAVTYWTDHLRGNGGDGAIDSAMFGQGRREKAQTMTLALEYASALQTVAGRR